MMNTKCLEKNFFSRHRKISVAELFHRKNWIVFPRKIVQNQIKSSQLFDKEIKNEIFLSFGKRSYFPIERGLVKGRNVKERVRTGTPISKRISACQGNSDISSVWWGQT